MPCTRLAHHGQLPTTMLHSWAPAARHTLPSVSTDLMRPYWRSMQHARLQALTATNQPPHQPPPRRTAANQQAADATPTRPPEHIRCVAAAPQGPLGSCLFPPGTGLGRGTEGPRCCAGAVTAERGHLGASSCSSNKACMLTASVCCTLPSASTGSLHALMWGGSTRPLSSNTQPPGLHSSVRWVHMDIYRLTCLHIQTPSPLYTPGPATHDAGSLAAPWRAVMALLPTQQCMLMGG